MTRLDPDLERRVRTWLRDGVDTIPDHVFDAVVDRMPATRQRRIGAWPPNPGTTRMLVAAAAVLVLAVTLVGLLIGTNVGDDDDATWHRLPSVHEAPLEAGRLLIDEPFPVRIGLSMPQGWIGLPIRETLAQIGRESGGAGIMFTVVEGLYADPCHNDAGLIDPPVGPAADDLAVALARLPGVAVAGPSDTTIDGVPAVALTITAPAVFEGCTTEPQAPMFKLWGVPEWHWLEPGERNRLWIVDVDGTRLVISAEEFEDSSPLALAELNGIVSSIDLDPMVDRVVDPSEALAPSFRPLPTSGLLTPGDYSAEIQLHRFAGGVPVPLLGRHRIEISVEEPGWSAATSGIERPGGGDATVGITAWSIGRIYADPCRWRAADADTVDPSELQTLDELADALGAPLASEPVDLPRYGGYGKYVEITIPPDLELDACDGGEYRLWEGSTGRARSAREPGERIGLYVVDAAPGLVVVDAWTLLSATDRDRKPLDRILNATWLRDPAPRTGE
jgi:hypothetical protein